MAIIVALQCLIACMLPVGAWCVCACNGTKSFALIRIIRSATQCMEDLSFQGGCGGPAVCSDVAMRHVLCGATAWAHLTCSATGATVL